MPRKTQRPNTTAQATANRFHWNLRADSAPDRIVDWDFKKEQFTDAILEVLQSGCKVQVSVRPWSGEVVIAIYGAADGDRAYLAAGDSEALDELTWSLVMKGREERLGDISQAAAAD